MDQNHFLQGLPRKLSLDHNILVLSGIFLYLFGGNLREKKSMDKFFLLLLTTTRDALRKRPLQC